MIISPLTEAPTRAWGPASVVATDRKSGAVSVSGEASFLRAVIPTFYVTSYPTIIGLLLQFNYAAPKAFTIQSFDRINSPNFLAAVKYRVGSTVYRYYLFGDMFDQYAPHYSGQSIGKYFCVEIWGIGTLSLNNSISLILSTLNTTGQSSLSGTQVAPKQINIPWSIPIDVGTDQAWIGN